MRSLLANAYPAVPRSPDNELRHQALWTTLGWGFVLLVIYLSLMRAPQVIPSEAFDVGHLFAYCWLMLWFAQIHRPAAARLAIGAGLCALGVTLEFAQGMTSYRTFDYADMAMNALGVMSGLLLACSRAQYGLRTVERLLGR